MLTIRNGQKDPGNLMGLEERAKINNKSLQDITLRVKQDQNQNLTGKVLSLSINDLQKNKRCKKKKQKNSKERNFNLKRIK